ncbi:MAG: hypothetical protein WCC48_08455 [Anaeromyxobacteraceae bacterium]
MTPADRSHSDNIAAEPARCPACGLKHMRQANWLCPRCGMPVETESYRSTMREPRAAEPERALGSPLGSFVAGAVMALTSVVLAVGFARHPVTEHRWALVAAMVLLAVLGLELLLKVSAARWVVAVIALAALLLASEELLRAWLPSLVADPLPPALRAALQGVIGALNTLRILLASGLFGGTLLLVIGRPGRWRIAAGVLLAAPLALFEIVRSFVP